MPFAQSLGLWTMQNLSPKIPILRSRPKYWDGKNKVLPERVNRGQCSFEKVLKHGTAARREKSEFLFGYARFLQQRDGVTASEDFLRVAFRYELRYRDRIAGIAVFVESRRAVPDDEARGGDNGCELCDRIGPDIYYLVPLLDLARLLHFCLLVFPLDRDVNRADKFRVGNNFFFGCVLGDARTAADGISLHAQHIIRYRTADAHVVIGGKERADEWVFRLKFCAADDGKRRMFRMQRLGEMADLVADDKPRV